jgi:CBS domain-containing protein
LAENEPHGNSRLRARANGEISGAPVVDEDGRVIGVLSARDLLRAIDEERDTAMVQTTYFRDLTEFSGPDRGSTAEDVQGRNSSW